MRVKYKASLILAVISVFLICNTCRAEFYRYNIDELARKAKVRLQEIEKKIAEEKIAKEIQEVLAKLRALSDEAESLFADRRYEEAVTIYRKIDRMSCDPKIVNLLSYFR